MKEISFVFFGAAKNSSFLEIEDIFFKRISHYVTAQKIIIKELTGRDVKVRLKQETEKVLQKISPKDFVIVCDEKGRAFDSVHFSKKLDTWLNQAQRVIFVVGSAYGLAAEIKERADQILKLSEMTLPHDLARLVLTEQVYRALTILNREKYHH